MDNIYILVLLSQMHHGPMVIRRSNFCYTISVRYSFLLFVTQGVGLLTTITSDYFQIDKSENSRGVTRSVVDNCGPKLVTKIHNPPKNSGKNFKYSSSNLILKIKLFFILFYKSNQHKDYILMVYL